MQLHRLIYEGLGGFSGQLDFPERGLVLCTGANGAGKSLTLIDALAWTLWGETPRGTDPAAGVAAKAHLQTGGIWVERKKTAAGSPRLSWGMQDEPAQRFESARKGQEALETIIGPFDAWYRATVFSAADASQFTLATDSQRKQLVEALVPGFLRFDPAAEACSADLRVARQRLTTASHELTVAQGQLAVLDARAQERAEQASVPASPTEEELEAARLRFAGLRKVQAAAEDALRREDPTGQLQQQALDAAAASQQMQAEQRRLAGAACPTCGQSIPDRLRGLLAIKLAAAWKEEGDLQIRLTAAKQRREAGLAGVRGALREVDGELEAARQRLEELRAQARVAREAAERAAAVAERAAAEAAERQRLSQVIAEATAQQAALAAEVALLEAVAQVLGVRGLRAALLDQTLAALELLTNQHLDRLWPGQAIRLGSTRQTKQGTTREEISLEIVGRGPAKALSGGQRRRLDFALFLARRDMLAAAGADVGPLTVDEALDTLDPEGVAGVAELLAEEARERLVTVISHVPDRLAGVRWDRRWVVQAGQVR